MKVLLNALKSSPDRSKHYQLEVDPPEELKDCLFTGFAEFTATFTGNGILVTGQITANYKDECHRCLDPVEKEIFTSFQEEFRQRESLEDELEQENDEEDEEEIVLEKEDLYQIETFSGNELDLTDFFRQMLILAIPPKILCREECPGLCAKCGAKLAEESCNCQQKDIDPRLAKLQKLKGEL